MTCSHCGPLDYREVGEAPDGTQFCALCGEDLLGEEGRADAPEEPHD